MYLRYPFYINNTVIRLRGGITTYITTFLMLHIFICIYFKYRAKLFDLWLGLKSLTFMQR